MRVAPAYFGDKFRSWTRTDTDARARGHVQGAAGAAGGVRMPSMPPVYVVDPSSILVPVSPPPLLSPTSAFYYSLPSYTTPSSLVFVCISSHRNYQTSVHALPTSPPSCSRSPTPTPLSVRTHYTQYIRPDLPRCSSAQYPHGAAAASRWVM
ncbi:hypothetical protein MSAN_00284900 [Mycena sanguinolenta]|uniref:Uncharacterized protein n=1 Tax=Mycena sanguinolenta TaxID=230812 RepID=A0A8H6ZAL3_9AGAR|nr:hypothetical protein MSAN_00284900 [Mycena sanguinolenta]